MTLCVTDERKVPIPVEVEHLVVMVAIMNQGQPMESTTHIVASGVI